MKTALIHSEAATRFDYGPEHPLRMERLGLTWRLMQAYGLTRLPGSVVLAPEPAAEIDIARFHSREYIDVLKPAEAPSKGPGLYFMDTSSAAAECVTLQAAAGFVVHLFPTGQGNVIGNPIEPVIKLTANPKTAREMSEHIDLDVSGILRREMTLDEAGDRLIDIMIRTCNGRLTAATSSFGVSLY